LDKDTIVRTVLAAAIVLVMWWAWSTYLAPRPPEPGEQPPTPPDRTGRPGQEAEDEAPPGEKAPGAEFYPLKAAGAEAPAEPVVLGSDLPIGPYDLEAEIHAEGAAVRRLTLARRDFFQTVSDRDLPAERREPMHLAGPDAPEPVLAVERFRLRLADRDGWGEVDLSGVPWRLRGEETTRDAAVFEVDVADEEGTRLVTVRKAYRLLKREASGGEAEAADVPQYEFRMAVELRVHDPRAEQACYVVRGPTALPREGQRRDWREAVVGSWTEGQVKAERLAGKAAHKGDVPRIGPEMAWIGQHDKYFTVVVIPLVPSPQGPAVLPTSPPAAGTFVAGARLDARKVTEGRQAVYLPVVRLDSKTVDLDAEAPVRHEFAVFAGPKEPDYLERYYHEIGLDRLVVWSQCCSFCAPVFAPISRVLLAVLDAFNSVVGNWGVAIIMLVIALQIVLLPVTKWSAKSMAEMQKMAPKMQEIREKYAGDKQKMQEELAKVGGLKAFGGCLPMFVQMPIWIGLYGALLAAIQLRHSAFLPAGWIPDGSLFLQDLSAPDMLVHWGTPLYIPGQEIPLLGWLIGGIQSMLSGGGGITSFNILPIAVGVLMYVSQKAMPMSSAAAANPQAQQQQKMMMRIMPLFLGVVLYSAPSGLCLYIMTSSLARLVETKVFRRRWMEAAKAKAEGAPDAGPVEPAKQQSLVSGRRKSISERIEAWVRRKTQEAQKQKRDARRKGGK